MQQGMYYEESATCSNSAREVKIWKIYHVVQWVFIVLAGLTAALAFMLAPAMIEACLKEKNTPALIFTLVTWIGGIGSLVLIAVMLWRLKLKRNVSYDYIFVEDELRISKVFNGKKRKFINKLKADHILKIGYCDRPSYETTSRGYDKKHIKFMTPNYDAAEGKFFFYIVYSTSVEKSIYIIEAREMMLEYLLRATGRNNFERE